MSHFAVNGYYIADDASVWQVMGESILSDGTGAPILLCACACASMHPVVRAETGVRASFASSGKHLHHPDALRLIREADIDLVDAFKGHRRHIMAGIEGEEKSCGLVIFDPRKHCSICVARRPEHEIHFRGSARLPKVD